MLTDFGLHDPGVLSDCPTSGIQYLSRAVSSIIASMHDLVLLGYKFMQAGL